MTKFIINSTKKEIIGVILAKEYYDVDKPESYLISINEGLDSVYVPVSDLTIIGGADA